MGIRGLLRLIIEDSVLKNVDLVEEAEKYGGLEIIVDFNAIFRFLMETFALKMAREYDNEYLHFPLGVYDKFTEAYSDLHTGFLEAGIRLVWVVDGPKGVDVLGSCQKAETWTKRVSHDIKLMNEMLSASKSASSTFNRNNVGPIMYFDIALLALKNVGAEVIHLLQGQADDFIAYEFHRRKSFAILTNDTDFVIFPDCVVIFQQMLSRCYGQNNLNLPFVDNENAGKIFKRPSHLKCPVVYPENILRLFQFTNHTQLIALSILNGNDSTSAYSTELAHHLGITTHPNYHPHVTEFANYIRRNPITSENIEQYPKIKEFMESHPQCGESIKFSKDLYSLKTIEDNKSIVVYNSSMTDDSLTSFLARKLAVGEISRIIYSIHFGVVHDFIVPEEPNENCPAIQTLLSKIRTRIYPFIVKETFSEVSEWRSRSTDNLVKVPFEHAALKTHLIKGKPAGKRRTQKQYGIDLFEDTICHQEKNGSLHYVDKYGIKKALTCYILRYLYVLTKDKNLRISDKEFRGLFATVFYQFSLSEGVKFDTKMNQDVVLRMKICPSKRCLIIAAWFMNVYDTAMNLCGAAFNLTQEFPLPSEIMSGPVFCAFYENSMCNKNWRTSHLEKALIDLVNKLENEVFSLYEEEFDLITELD